MNRKDRRAAGKGSGALKFAALFGEAVRHHQAGRLFEAESLYRQVLAGDGNHVGCLQHLGILALQRGHPAAAVDALGRALAVDGRNPECHYNMAFALHQVGRAQEAAEHYRKAIALKPDHVAARTNLGNVLDQLGRFDESVVCYEQVVAATPTAAAHYNLANGLAKLGRLDDAVAHFRQAVTLAPDLAEAHNNLANALVSQGRTVEALEHFERAIALRPSLIQAHVNLGSALLGLGRLEAAAQRLERALAIDAKAPEAHLNLGNIELVRGRLGDAEQCFRRALALAPGLVEALNNLGIVLAASGRYEEAVRQFDTALAQRPDFIDGYNNIARAFLALGRPDDALGALRKALAVSEATETKSLLVQCVRLLPAVPDLDDFRALMLRALSEPWGRANDLVPVVTRVVKQDPAIRAGITCVMAAWPGRPSIAELLRPSGVTALAAQPLLRCLLEAAVIADLELERFLTALRSALLEMAALDAAAEPAVVELACALARQCFLNEQVFATTPEEEAWAERLRDSVVAAAASGSAIAELSLTMVASYFPLHALPGASVLLQRTWSPALAGVVAQQVREPAEERELRAALPTLTPVDDVVSRAVQQQYEENPYPRWQKTEPAGAPLPFDLYLRRKLPAVAFRPLGRSEYDVLIAGCGTGQHAIETSRRFAGSRVLAIDLSRTSLAYAARKTREQGVQNIQYAQADILQLGALGRSFDVIETSGVLHHLADPLVGWRVLTALLRPGGFMTVGLYSELARAEIVAARTFIAEQGYRSTAEDIRRCRQEILDQGLFRDIAASGDFGSVSGCRDLLFHVQEHRLRLPEIAAFLAETGLDFLGFDLVASTARCYQQRFSQDRAMTDLTCWDLFEQEHPTTFVGMYQFWVQKPY